MFPTMVRRTRPSFRPIREAKTPVAPNEPEQAVVGQRSLTDPKTSGRSRTHLAGHLRVPALNRLVRRRILAVELARGTLGMAGIGALGGALGNLLLAHTVRSSGPYAAAFQAAFGSFIIAGATFAILGALGHVVFGDLVGDFRTAAGRGDTSREDRIADAAVEFVGGATWGIVCGMLIGVLGGTAGSLLGLPLGPVQSGTVGGALLGFVLEVLANVCRSIRGKREPREAPAFPLFSSSSSPADEQFTRRQ